MYAIRRQRGISWQPLRGRRVGRHYVRLKCFRIIVREFEKEKKKTRKNIDPNETTCLRKVLFNIFFCFRFDESPF